MSLSTLQVERFVVSDRNLCKGQSLKIGHDAPRESRGLFTIPNPFLKSLETIQIGGEENERRNETDVHVCANICRLHTP